MRVKKQELCEAHEARLKLVEESVVRIDSRMWAILIGVAATAILTVLNIAVSASRIAQAH